MSRNINSVILNGMIVETECTKSSNLDLELMINNTRKCFDNIKKIKSQETNALRLSALTELETTLEYHKDVFQNKFQQIDTSTKQKSSGDTKTEDKSKENVDNQTKSRKLAIEDTIVSKGHLKLDDVAGLKEAKQTLKEAIIIPLLFPHLFTGGRKPWRRILLYGPPGTGKTRLAQAVASEIQSTFYCVSSSDLVSSWVGESEKLIKELFQHAMTQTGRSVIFIDEIDSICRKRSSREEEYTRRIKTELLKQMEGANSNNSDQIFLLCATNCPWEIDSAFIRRFQKRIYIPLPEKEARLTLMHIHTKDNPVQLSEKERELLGDRTQGYSGSDIATMVLGALFEPIRHMQLAEYWKYTESRQIVACEKDDTDSFSALMVDLPREKVIPKEVTIDDFLKSLDTNRNTVTPDELTKFETFTKDFGVSG